MTITTICIFIAFTILPIAAIAQSAPHGVYVQEPVQGFRTKYILELTSDKFYTYLLPIDIKGTIIIKTGTYTIADTLITLHTDTTAGYSMDTKCLAFMHVNCDSPYNEFFHIEGYSITFSQETVVLNSSDLIELEYSADSDLVIALKRIGGCTHAQLKSYLDLPTGVGLKVCNE